MTASNLVLILYQPQEIVNVAAVIRGMSNFGLPTLRLITPAAWDPYRIAGIAHHTERIIETVEPYESLEAAMHDVSFALATTGRPRSGEHLVFEPRTAAPHLVQRAQAGERVAILFGTEKDGLPNEAVQRCHGILTIPTPGFNRSLNLAQSAILIMYELGLALASAEGAADESKVTSEGAASVARAPGAHLLLPDAPLATGAEREALFSAFEGLLGALYPHSPADRMAGSLARFRTLLMRANPTAEEAQALTNLLRHAARKGEAADDPAEVSIEVEKGYATRDVVAKLRRLASALEAGKGYEIQIAGERIYVPPTAEVEFEFEQEGDEAELEIELSWTRKPGALTGLA